ncbi:MAG: hypothetical protein WC717_01805 [Candidatus Micrarchaeia archaeon]|jgi:hypothetical protein
MLQTYIPGTEKAIPSKEAALAGKARAQYALSESKPHKKFLLWLRHPIRGSKTAGALVEGIRKEEKKNEKLADENTSLKIDLSMKDFILKFNGDAKCEMDLLYEMVTGKKYSGQPSSLGIDKGSFYGAEAVENVILREIGTFERFSGAKADYTQLKIIPKTLVPISILPLEKLVVCALAASRKAYPDEAPFVRLAANANTGGLTLSIGPLNDDAFPLLSAAAMKANEHAQAGLESGTLKVELRPARPRFSI